MRLSEFTYKLPSELIADKPLDNRSDSKLLVVDRDSRKTRNAKFIEIIDYLKEGDCLVLNNTKVIPARLIGSIDGFNNKVEILLIEEIENDLWEVISKKSKKLNVGTKLFFCRDLKGEIQSKSNGRITIKFKHTGKFDEILEKFGNMPLPPYILKKRSRDCPNFFERKNGTVPINTIDKERYQTVFAKVKGSIAAPTAGLHFTDEIINSIKLKGIKVLEITLHIGIGTFKPIRVQNVEEHYMDKEYFEISKEVIDIINNTRKNGNKIIGVGSTVTRALEYVYSNGTVPRGDCPHEGCADIFIYPGFKFNVVDRIITNFHLPASTPFLLVCAFADKDLIFYAYNSAIKNNYRFLSYGDAMLII